MSGGHRALYKLAGGCVRARWVVLAAWVVATIVLVGLSHRLGEETNDNLSLPGNGQPLRPVRAPGPFPGQANGSSPIVLHAAHGKLTEPKLKEAVDEAAAEVAKAEHVAGVVSPLTPQGSSALSKDGSTGYLSVSAGREPRRTLGRRSEKIIDAAAKPARAAGLEVETGGQLGQKVSKPATDSSELVGIVAAMILLALTFGTVTAMVLPIAVALCALLSTLAIIRLLGHVVTVPTVAPTLATMIGLGVGIDYALFIVTRHLRWRTEGVGDARGGRPRGRHLGRRRDLRGLAP